MSAVAERIQRVRESEHKEQQLLFEQAKELWSVIAPGREPSAETAAVLDFSFKAPGTKAEGVEQRLFAHLLHEYWFSDDELYTVFLKVNPNYAKGNQKDDSDFSFKLAITAPPPAMPPEVPRAAEPLALFIHEYPRKSGLVGYLGPLYALQILGEGPHVYTARKLDHQLVGVDQNGSAEWQSYFHPEYRIKGFTRRNMLWRKHFVSEVLELLINVARQQPEARWMDYDEGFQEWMEKFGDPFKSD